MSASPRSREGVVDVVLRVGRALLVGSGATFVDLAVLTACVRMLDVAPAVARVPALVAGASFQFFGHRAFTFRAQSGAISRQARLFLAVEAVAFALNLSIFEFLLAHIPALPPELLGLAASFIVFATFAYPMHRRVSFAFSGSEASCSE